MHGSRRKFEAFTKAKKDTAYGQPMSQAHQDALKSTHRLRFFGWLLSALAAIGTPGKRQLWYLTSVIKFLGMSRLGQNVMHGFGFSSTLRFSDGRQGVQLDVYDELLRYRPLLEPHVYIANVLP